MSLMNHVEFGDAWTQAREHIIADFRDFRFTWAGFFRWTGIVLAAFLIAAIVTLYFLDWNQMRGVIGRYASARTGRTVQIQGDLKVKLFQLQPHVDIGGLYIGNPAWVPQPQGARINQAAVEFRLFPALFGHWVLPLVKLDQAEALLVRRADGATNWDSPHAGNGTSFAIPPINRLVIANGHVEIDDAIRKLKFVGTVSSEENVAAGQNAFVLKGDGTLNGNKFVADVHGGPLLNVDESKPYAFNADIHAGDTHAVIEGAIAHPFHLDQFSAHTMFSGSNLADLYYLTGLALPGTPPYHVTGNLKRNGNFYSFTNVAGMIGGSDMNGFLTVDVAGRLPDLRGHLSSRVLNFDDLGALFRGGKRVAAADPYLLPDVTLHTEKLRELNGEVDYDADAIRSRDLPLRGFSTHISVKNGVLSLKPLAFSFTSGKLTGSVSIDGRKAVPTTSVDARVTDIEVSHFIKGTDKPVQGTVEARARLTGTGSSVHKAAAAANGTLTGVIPSGAIRHSLAEWLGVNVISALGLNLSGNTADTQIRCAVAHFEAKDGVMTAQQFVFDTEPVRVDGSGTINLRDETVDLRLQGAPKSFQFLRLHAPITVSGPLAKPALGVDAKPLVVQGAIGVGLALLNPAAAILAFVDPGMAKDANCAGILTTAKGQGAPVKQSSVNRAAAAQKTK